MNTLILHSSEPQHWNPEAWLLAQGGRPHSMPDGSTEISVQKDRHWLSFSHVPDILNDYEDEERHALLALIEPKKSYVVIWRHDEQLQWFIEAIPQQSPVVVDNDHGIICKLDEVQHLPLDEWIRRPELLKSEV